MYMTDNEIRRIWRNGAFEPKKMIQCIAELNGCRYEDSRKRCEKIGLIPQGSYRKANATNGNSGERWEEEDLRNLALLWEEGLSIPTIAKRIGRSKRSVENKLHRAISDGSIYEFLIVNSFEQ